MMCIDFFVEVPPFALYNIYLQVLVVVMIVVFPAHDVALSHSHAIRFVAHTRTH